ncbi:uncharacterized protein LOC127097099 [Lathyrus oleraceus]|uniref:uncharacterized protein LOC127097099 n=1 Tax=Pisum sativum TaxID=3888 RepID=UPI0021D046CE|nr:uncharacterized protein LOC127097099 [Pisum sativum]
MNQSVQGAATKISTTNENEVRGGDDAQINNKDIAELQKDKRISKSTERSSTRKRQQISSGNTLSRSPICMIQANNNVQINNEDIGKVQKGNQQRVKFQKLTHKNKKTPKSTEGSSATKRKQNLGGSSPFKPLTYRMRASNDPQVIMEKSQKLAHKKKKTPNSTEGSSTSNRKKNHGESSLSRPFTCRMRLSNDPRVQIEESQKLARENKKTSKSIEGSSTRKRK